MHRPIVRLKRQVKMAGLDHRIRGRRNGAFAMLQRLSGQFSNSRHQTPVAGMPERSTGRGDALDLADGPSNVVHMIQVVE